ncbi:MAG: signal peptidase II, partial [Lachnospiraceae bacterium]
RIVFKMWQTGGAKGVRDMVDVSGIKFGSFNFGICNFADFFITAGAILLVLSFLFFDSEALFPTKKSKALAETLAAERGGNEKTEANDKTDGGADESDKTGEEGGGH